MSTHPLIQHATRRPYNETPTMPDGSVYDRVSGYWVYKGEPLVKNNQFTIHHASKKCDQETGEDLKGE